MEVRNNKKMKRGRWPVLLLPAAEDGSESGPVTMTVWRYEEFREEYEVWEFSGIIWIF